MATPYDTATRLDGFIANGDDSLDGPLPLGDIGDPAFIAQVGALAMGATTCERILRHAGQPAEDAGLLDGAILPVASVTLGQGKPLCPRRGAASDA
jgi:hypothetical protein